MRIILLTVAVLLIASTSPADHIGLYSSPAGGPCLLLAPPFTPVSVWVIHRYSVGTRGSKWKVDNTSGLTDIGSACGDGLKIAIVDGSPYQGIELSYSDCETSANLCQLNLMKFSADPVPGCYQMRVVAFPGEATPLAVDCSLSFGAATGGAFSFDGTDCDDCILPAERSTWGSVKALYR